VSPDQERRAQCITLARQVIPSGDVMDLVAVASWLATGEDPWRTIGTPAKKAASK